MLKSIAHGGVLLILVLLVAACADEDFDDGWNAFKAKNYAEALRIWKPLAEEGDHEAGYFLGHLYEQGLGVPRDITEALKWYKKSGEAGNGRAINRFRTLKKSSEVTHDKSKTNRRGRESFLDGSRRQL